MFEGSAWIFLACCKRHIPLYGQFCMESVPDPYKRMEQIGGGAGTATRTLGLERLTCEGCVEMFIPWQLCQTMGPLLIVQQPGVKG